MARDRKRRGAAAGASRFVTAGVVLLALAGLYAVAGHGIRVRLTAGRAIQTAARAPVTTAIAACPGPGSGGATGGKVAVANMPASPGSRPGQVQVSPLVPGGSTAPGKAVQVLTQPGQLAVTAIKNAAAPAASGGRPARSGTAPVSPGRGGVMVQASGAMAQGLDVEQLSYGGEPTARCQTPGTDFWFVSPVTTASRFYLYLMNTGSQAANVSVTAVTDSGPVLGSSDSGIAVPPHAMVQQQLSTLLHGARVAGIHVTTATGQIVAAIREAASAAKAGSWLPAVPPPSKTQVLPGLPGTPGTPELYVDVPGTAGAQVKITAVTTHGSYQPTGGTGISVPGSSAFAIPLQALGGVSAAVKVSANVPVTSMIIVAGTPAGTAGAFIAGAGPIERQGVLAASPIGSASPATLYSPASPAASSELVLSAPGRAATVEVSVAGTRTSLRGQATQTLQIPAGHSIVVHLKTPSGQAGGAVIAAVLTPTATSGPVYAARVARLGGALEVIQPVISSPTWISLPAVRSSLATIVASGGQPARHR